MKKVILLFVLATISSCSSTAVKSTEPNKLYEVLSQQENGGASIRFFEILSEANEIAMLQNDENLKNKISTTDIQNANFIILNMGEKSSGGYKIGIETIVETATNIIVTVKETIPEQGSMVTQALTNPFCVVQINSKKAILFK
jgi:hypothetical protein